MNHMSYLLNTPDKMPLRYCLLGYLGNIDRKVNADMREDGQRFRLSRDLEPPYHNFRMVVALWTLLPTVLH